MRLHTLFASIVVVAPFAFAGEVAHEAVSQLGRPDGSPQGDAHGNCNVRDGADFQRFTVVVEGLHGDGAFHVLLGDGHDGMGDIGAMTRSGGAATYNRTTLEGGELPYGIDSVRALGGRHVQVVDGEHHVILDGKVPVIHDEPPPPPPPKDGDPVITRSEMHRTNEAGDKDCRGALIASTRADGSGLKLEVGHLDAEHSYLVYFWVEEDLTLWHEIHTNGEGNATLSGDTSTDAGLPLHAESVAALAGRRVEVRDHDGHIYLYGEVPAAESHADEKATHEADHQKDSETGTDVHIAVDIKPAKGREEMHIVVKHLPRAAVSPGKRARPVVSIRFEEDVPGVFTQVGNAAVHGRRAVKHWTTRRGRELPLGVESLRDLSGRKFEMYLGGTRVAAGTLPQY